jgi:cytochrome d ubiquinol oxidase subunit I
VSSEVTVDRLQLTLTVTYHYLFPILTMGLALFIAYFKTVSYLGHEDRRFPPLRKTAEERATAEAEAHFWTKIFAVNFAFGVAPASRWSSSSAPTGPSSPTSRAA